MTERRGVLFAALVGVGLLAIIAAVVMFVAAIWTGDERWGWTATVIGGTGPIVCFATVTYPGWEW